MRYKKELMLSLIGLFLISFVSAGLCIDTGCPATWCEHAAYENIICDGHETNVNVNPGSKLFCEYDEITSTWVNISGRYPVVPGYTLLPYQDPAIVEEKSEDTCCPIGSYYDSSSGECKDSVINFCWNYTTETECRENVVVGTAQKSIATLLGDDYGGFCETAIVSASWSEGSENCANETDYCRCIWIGDAATGECQSKYSTKKVCSNGTTVDVGSCQWELGTWDESACASGGDITGTWIATWIGTGPASAECVDINNENIPCDVVTKLSFFGWFNIIFVILGIVGLYFFKKD